MTLLSFCAVTLLLAGQVSAQSSCFIPSMCCRVCPQAPAVGNFDFPSISFNVNVSSCDLLMCEEEQMCVYFFITYVSLSEMTTNQTSPAEYSFHSECLDTVQEIPMDCRPVPDDRPNLHCQQNCEGEGCGQTTGSVTAEFDLSHLVEATEATTPPSTPPSSPETGTIVGSVVGVLGLALLVVVPVIVCAVCWWRTNKQERVSSEPPLPTELQDLESLPVGERPSWVLQQQIGHGRYGYVYRALYRGEEVAVKLYNNHTYWENERNLFSMESTSHENVLEFITAELRTTGSVERALVTKYYPLGTLQHYLRTHKLSWEQACNMILSMSQGLAHLHGSHYLNSDGVQCDKYPIAHRDIKSANIFTRDHTGECVIGDLGFALLLDQTEFQGVSQAGTLRYMAPELLDGRVSLHAEAYKQIDAYAFGLVSWEVASRTDVTPGEEVPDYKLPFEDEAGPRPRLQGMKDLVITKKLLPSLPSIWANSAGLCTLQQLITECCDYDPEARLTAANVSYQMKLLMSRSTTQDTVLMGAGPSTVSTGSVTLDPHRPTEHSQSSPPPYYSPTDPESFGFHTSLNQQRQVSMPQINHYTGESYARERPHMAARCTRSLRSTYCEDPSPFIVRRNSLVTGSQPDCHREEMIRELSQSPFGCPETAQLGPAGSLDGQEIGLIGLNDSGHISNLNSDSEITHSELSHTPNTIARAEEELLGPAEQLSHVTSPNCPIEGSEASTVTSV